MGRRIVIVVNSIVGAGRWRYIDKRIQESKCSRIANRPDVSLLSQRGGIYILSNQEREIDAPVECRRWPAITMKEEEKEGGSTGRGPGVAESVLVLCEMR